MGTPALATPIHLENVKSFAELPEGGTVEQIAQAATLWLHTTVRAMCNRPESVWIDVRITDRQLVFDFNVDPADYGCIVGKQGRNMRALRQIFYAMGKSYRTLFELNLAPPAEVR